MCKKRNLVLLNIRGKHIRVDKCMVHLLIFLEGVKLKTVACCCGHGKYNMSIVMDDGFGGFYDLMSNVEIPRKKRFYLKDKKGFYYIPEVKKDGNYN